MMLPLESRVLDHPSLRTLALRVFEAVSQQPRGAAFGQCGHWSMPVIGFMSARSSEE
jgi:hypothetical protein